MQHILLNITLLILSGLNDLETDCAQKVIFQTILQTVCGRTSDESLQSTGVIIVIIIILIQWGIKFPEIIKQSVNV